MAAAQAALQGLVVDLSAALKATMSPELSARQQAEQHLSQFRESNFPGYLASLIAELNNESREADVRQAAGLLLKNAVDAKEEARRADLAAKWVAVDGALKQAIRDILLQCLHAPVADVRKTTALVVSKIASIDLQRKEWPQLIQTLLANMGAQPGVAGTRQATLMALGYICEEIDEGLLEPEHVNMILTAVVAGMGPQEADESRLAAINALTNAINFAKHNFEMENERNYLMQVVCQGTQAPNHLIRLASFECLHQIAENYYAKLQPYMTELYNITTKAMKEDQDEVATQAIEFWNTVAEYELELLEDGDDSECRNFIASAAQYLMPILLESLTKQDEDALEDDGTWNVAMASGFCIKLVARICRDRIVPMVIQFVTTNISRNAAADDWHYREAATFAFGAILDGPSPQSLDEIVRQGLPFLFSALKDPHRLVRETTAWTLGQIFEHVHGAEADGAAPIISKEMLPGMLTALAESLKDEPRVAYYICDAVRQLALGYGQENAETSPLSPYFKDLVQKLFETAELHRTHPSDAGNKVQIAAYEAINDLVRSSALDTLEFVVTLLKVVLDQITATFSVTPGSPEQAERISTLQGQFCGMLQVSIEKLCRRDHTKAALLPMADKIMETLLRIFTSTRGTGVHEEAMLAVGTFTVALGENFRTYLPQFVPFLQAGLTNHQEWQVCLSTVGVLGDVCRAVGNALLPFCDDLVSIMLLNLGSPAVHRNIKPELLTTLGDVAMAVEGQFAKYFEAVLTILHQAMTMSVQMVVPNGDMDVFDYNNLLRRGILEALSGIIQGVGDDVTSGQNFGPQVAERIKGELPTIMTFVSSIGADMTAGEEGYDEIVARAAITLMGDMCMVLPAIGPMIASHPQKEWVNLVQFAVSIGNESGSSNNTDWAINVLRKHTGLPLA